MISINSFVCNMTTPRIITWGLSGFGPRYALYLIHQAIVILANQPTPSSLKENHGIDFTPR
jgi:hypothetical protein